MDFRFDPKGGGVSAARPLHVRLEGISVCGGRVCGPRGSLIPHSIIHVQLLEGSSAAVGRVLLVRGGVYRDPRVAVSCDWALFLVLRFRDL